MTVHDPNCPHCVQIDGLNFYPWRGTSYGNPAFGAKILVMGESTYGGQDDRLDYDNCGPSWFAHLVLAYCRGDWSNSSFWSKWLGLFLGRPPRELMDRQRVLQNVAFLELCRCDAVE